MNARLSTRRFIPAAFLVFGLATGVCSLPMPASAQHNMHEMGGMQMDTAMMRRHMREADSMVAHVRREVKRMRQLAPERWHAEMPRYSATVDSMFAMMQRHHLEMDHAMQHAQMHKDMREMHERMMRKVAELHTEVRQLGSASPSELRKRMPAHLDRMDRMLEMMDQMHAQMRAQMRS